ncbi:MAG: multidrug effflux MFS transporter [Caldilineaceae bacterium]|nr:multidrug effflux MFS transporter [Caldilineaceae bacterium]
MVKVDRPQAELKFGEFVALMAMITSLAALATDAMLPALAEIGAELGVVRANDNQLIISLLFLGLAGGQILYGPVSDSVGRKPTIYVGYGIFFVGCLLSVFAVSFPMMLAGRLFQGIGIAGPRSVTMALIRDKYAGRSMARVMSFVMVVFILVPIIAPTFGQAILLVADWRAIFVSFLALGVATALWFALRQPETLPVERRVPFSLLRIGRAIREVLFNRRALGYTVTAGLISGGFLGYLSSSQQIFQIQYGLGARFPLIFATLAVALGCASFLNGRLVMRYGMVALSKWSSRTLAVISILFLLFAWTQAGHPPLWTLIGYMMPALFCVGVLFGNLNALAMEPLGHIAGVGAAVVGSLSLLIAVFFSSLIGQSYDGTVLPLIAGFAILSTAGVLLMAWVQRRAQE